MPFNLKIDNYVQTRIGYFAYTYGVDCNDNRCMMVLHRDPTASGCDPFYWGPSRHERRGHEFASEQEALDHARIASHYNYSVKSIEVENIKTVGIEFSTVLHAKILKTA